MDYTQFKDCKRPDIFDTLPKTMTNHHTTSDNHDTKAESASNSLKMREIAAVENYRLQRQPHLDHQDDSVPYEKRRSFKSIWQNFVENTTLHGVVYIQQSNIPVIGKVMWCVLVLGMLGSLSYVLIDLLLRYREYPFTSVWGLRRQATIDAPTLTMCPENVMDAKKIRESSRTIQNFFNQEWWVGERTAEEMKQFDNMTYSSLLNTHTFSKEDLIFYATLERRRVAVLRGTDFVTKRQFSQRPCFTINDFRDEMQLGEISEDNHVQVFFNLRRNDLYDNVEHLGIYVYIHKKGTSMQSLQPIMVAPGFSFYIKFKQIDYTFLPLPYKSFENVGCVDLNDSGFVNRLVLHPFYTRDNCLDELIEIMSAETCGCVATDYIDLLESRECTAYEMLACVWPLSFHVFQNATRYNSTVSQKCPHACNTTIIEASVSTLMYDPKLRKNSTYKEQDYVQLIVQPKTTNVETVKHEPELTVMDILAVVGGYLGLFLGASLMTAAELLQVLMATLKHLLWDKQRQTIKH